MVSTRFAIITDTHYVYPTSATDSTLWNRQLLSRTEVLAEALVQAVAKSNVDFVVHCGDLTHDGDLPSLEFAADVFERFDRPVLFVLGNHDTTTSGAREFLERIFGLPIVSGIGVRELFKLKFLLLDSNFGTDSVGAGSPAMNWRTPEQYAGIGFSTNQLEALAGMASIPPLVVVHNPLFAAPTLPRMFHRDGSAAEFRMDPIPKSYWAHRGEEVVRELARRAQPTCILSGHWHLSQIFQADTLQQVISTSLIEYPFEYRIAEFQNGTLTLSTCRLEVPREIEASLDPNWNNGWFAGRTEDRTVTLRMGSSNRDL